jgi:hypothetical protein
MPTIPDLIIVVESVTGRRFLGAAHRKAYATRWFEDQNHLWFSNRPFPEQQEGKPPLRRKAKELSDEESFFRLDLEYDDHNEVPTEADVDEAVRCAKAIGALGAVRTPHGMHIYLLTKQPLMYSTGAVKAFIKSSLPPMRLEVCAASWSRNNWSRFVSELLFFAPEARVDVGTFVANFGPTQHEPKKGYGKWRKPSSEGSSEPEKNAEFSQIVGSLLRNRTRDEIAARLVYHTPDELDAAIARTKADPDYQIDGINTTGRNHEWFRGGAKRRKYWVHDRTPVGLIGPHSSSRQIQMDKSILTNFGHSVQRFWDRCRRRYETADEPDKEHIRNETIGAALLWLERSKDSRAGIFRVWWERQFPGKDERGAAHWWMAAHEDIEALWSKYGPDGTAQAEVGEKLKSQIMASLSSTPSNAPQLAKELNYSLRQMRRALHALRTEGHIESHEQNRHQMWRPIKPTDPHDIADDRNPDTHVNPVEGLHARFDDKTHEKIEVCGLKWIEIPRKRRLRGLSSRQKLAERRRRAYSACIWRTKATMTHGHLQRLLSLPRSEAKYWAPRPREFQEQWCVFCRMRYRVWRTGETSPVFADWLSRRRRSVSPNASSIKINALDLLPPRPAPSASRQLEPSKNSG